MVAPYFNITTRENKLKNKSGSSTLQPATRYQLELPTVDPEQYPVVAAALELGAVITGISEDMELPEWVSPIPINSLNLFLGE